MAPVVLWGLVGLGSLVGGYFRYEQVKVGDLLKVKTDVLPAIMKVTAINKTNGQKIISGTLIEGNTNTDTKVPVSVTPDKVLQNITPRLW